MEASPKFDTGSASSLRRGLLSTQGDRTLAALAARGNASAFDTIHARYHRRIFVYVCGLLGRGANTEDAEDLTQDVFQSAFRSLESQRPDGSLKAWLYAIARNRTYDHLRANRVTLVEISNETAAAADTEQIVAGRIELAWLMTTLDDLPERQREALVLREMGGLSYGEIAATLETTEASVKQLLTRARTAVVAAANEAEVRPPRRLGKSINSLFPVSTALPGGAGIASALGLGGGGAVFGAGGSSTAAKFAVGGVLAATLLGGGAVGVESALDNSSGGGVGSDGTPSLERTVAPGQDATDDRSGRDGGGEDRSGRGGDDDRSDDRGSDRDGSDDRSDDRGGGDSESRELSRSHDGSDDPPEPETEDPTSDGSGSRGGESGGGDDSGPGGGSGSGDGGSGGGSDDPPEPQ